MEGSPLSPTPPASSRSIVDRGAHRALGSPMVASRQKREAAAHFPRAELWSWSMRPDSITGAAKDDVIEDMLRECTTTVGIGSVAASSASLNPPGIDLRRPHLLHRHSSHQLHQSAQQLHLHPHPQQEQGSPPGSRRKLPAKGLPSTRNLSPTATPPLRRDSGSGGGSGNNSTGGSIRGGGGWRAYKLAHRTNRLMSKTRRFLEALSSNDKGEDRGLKSRETGSRGERRSQTHGVDLTKGASDTQPASGQPAATENFAAIRDTLHGDTVNQIESENSEAEPEHVLVARRKLQLAREQFEREVLSCSDEDVESITRTKRHGLSGESSDFWDFYHASSTNKRPDSARGRYIARCEDASLLVLPVLDLKNKPRRYDTESHALRYDDYYLGDVRAQALGGSLNLLPVQVQSLSMKNVGVTGIGSSAIMDGIPLSHLNHLNLSENRLGVEGTERIYVALRDPHVNLRSLDLGNNQLGDAVVRTLVDCLLNRCTLEYLNLKRNRIYLAARAIGELLRISTPLKTLNLSWNNIRGEPAQHLARCMMENLTLKTLDLSDNTLGNGGSADAELGACLANNKSLQHLDISNNHVRGRTVIVYIHGLQQNAAGSALESLVLRGNPIGAVGAETVMRAAACGAVTKCQIDIGGCNLDMVDDNLNNRGNNSTNGNQGAPTMVASTSIYAGGGLFTVNMRERADAALLRELLALYWRNKLELVDASLNGASYTATLSAAKSKGDEKAIAAGIPNSGVLQIKLQPNYERREEFLSAQGFEALYALLSRSFGAVNDGDEAAKLSCIRLLAEEFTFTVGQANLILSLFRSHTTQVEKASAAAVLIPQIVANTNVSSRQEVLDCANIEAPQEFFEDKDQDGKIDACGDICVVLGLEKQLSDLEQAYVEKKVGKWVSFNAANPTGKYTLNMAQSIDRRILLRILEFNKNEKRLRQQFKLMDISQSGPSVSTSALGGGGFRNVRLNRMPVDVTAPWEFPLLGSLDFDFASSRKPFRVCTALSDAAFDQFLKEFKQLQVPPEVKLIGLRSVSSLYYFSCAQTQRLMEHFGTFERDPTTGTLLRAEVLIILFTRIVDEWNLSEALALLDLATKAQVFDRLGWLNCFHPLQQAESYKALHLKNYEHRQLVLMLVKLAAGGEIELSNVVLTAGDGASSSASAGVTVEPDQWRSWASEDKLPLDGDLSCSMRSTSPASTQPEAQLPPTSMRKKLLQSLILKLDDRSHEHMA